MKITLTESLIDSLTTLSPESANQVLNACRELMKLDNDAIEQYELEADAPQALHDIVANMKKRAAAARRRRERREAKAAQATLTVGTDVPAKPVNHEYAEAIDLLFSDTPISTHHQCELMHRLVVFITERLTPATQQPTPAPTATGKKSRRRRHRRSRSKRH